MPEIANKSWPRLVADLRETRCSALPSEELVWMGDLGFPTIYTHEVPTASICAILLMELTYFCFLRKLSALQKVTAIVRTKVHSVTLLLHDQLTCI